ncbi:MULTISPECIES: low molecular weight protein-tyrosine-phosphatase [unclassified Variovorax]|uniref:low molecular weight protein-tyrosine-phosphatase n=1 Tax=unclassified Variovorax TaxID=663243 RepID=UPI00076D0DBB|nr:MULTISPECIES: low molecular weight protein-tyrosine-phosphatase [unclassified Variovorax]KWT69030.1 Low molecular weight protein-tyrosine-phosphatase Wzb [Variovorax sp. WDL1]PNG51529.1 Low molecular weight protein-tyrosine-phosphatase Ptp [Variovorax sp. B2]PNG54445.1 Low molecular weight protein-tyrosine-phosphatase Ptp [Variovorax sp. B4]VTV11950.1 Low molecular weight protein-tyrosine-phosphatase ptp [Variovorax sp. WDL1]
MTRHILVLCSGNVCRSPVAAALLAHELPGKTIRSAGLAAPVGAPADPMAVEFAAARSLDLSLHRAQHVNFAMCRAADLILVMEQRHTAELRRRYPQVWGKVFRVGEAAGLDIADPYRKPRKIFEAICIDVAAGIAAWAGRIRALERSRVLPTQPIAYCE